MAAASTLLHRLLRIINRQTNEVGETMERPQEQIEVRALHRHINRLTKIIANVGTAHIRGGSQFLSPTMGTSSSSQVS